MPIDDSVCQLVHRLRFFRSLSAIPPAGLLLARRNRSTLLRDLRTELIQLRTSLGIALSVAKTSRNLAVGDENSQRGNLPRQISAAHAKRFVSGANGTTVRRDPRAEHEPRIQRTV